MNDPITKGQKTKLWTCAKEANLSKEALYNIIYSVSQKENMKELTKQEAHKCIECLIKNFNTSEGKYKPFKKTPSSKGNLFAKMTPLQKRKILAQAYDLGWDSPTLDEFLKKICKRSWKTLTKELASDFYRGSQGCPGNSSKIISLL